MDNKKPAMLKYTCGCGKPMGFAGIKVKSWRYRCGVPGVTKGCGKVVILEVVDGKVVVCKQTG